MFLYIFILILIVYLLFFYKPPPPIFKAVKENRAIVIFFRGTKLDSYKNILTDVSILKKDIKHGSVHEGFLNAYSTIKEKVRNAVKEAREKCPNCDVIITGHSLGGALSIMCATDLYDQNLIIPSKTYVYTIGSPRIGNKKFAVWFSNTFPNTYRITKENDIVSKLPSSILGYVHVGREVFFKEDNKDPIICNFGEDENCNKGTDFKIIKGIEDHLDYLDEGIEKCPYKE